MSVTIEQDLKEILNKFEQNKALDERIKGVDERLKSVEFINRSVVVGLVLALTAGFLKLFFPGFPSNP